MRGTQLVTGLVIVALVLASIPGGTLALGAADLGGSEVTPDQATGSNTTQPTTGQQLATVIAVTDEEVTSDIEQTTFEAGLTADNESARAQLLAERAATLRNQTETLLRAQQNATGAYLAGELTRGEFAQRLAVLGARAKSVDRGFTRLDERARNASALELRAAGFDREGNTQAQTSVQRLSSAGVNGLLAQYTGAQRGSFSLEANGGLSIAVEGEDGERTREFERAQPGNGTFEVSQSTALAAATAQLDTDRDGNWTLRAVDRDEAGYYEFEFRFFGPNTTGEAEVSVDGQTGAVFELESELDVRERAEREDGPLAISIVDGDVEPGANVTLAVRAAGEPVDGAAVSLGEETVGETDASGQITLQLPDAEAVEIEAEHGDREGELELRLRDERPEEVERAEIQERLNATGSVDNGTVTVQVTYDGEGVPGVSVFAGGDRVGTTARDGTLSFETAVREELDVRLVKGQFRATLEFEVDDAGRLTVEETEIEDDRDEAADRGRETVERDDDAEDRPGHEEMGENGPPAVENRTDEDAESETESEPVEDLHIRVGSGVPAPNATVTLEVTADGEPVSNATVRIEETVVGATDESGQLSVQFPEAEEVEVSVERGEQAGEREFEFDERGHGPPVETDEDREPGQPPEPED